MTEVCVDVHLSYQDTTGAPFVSFAEEMLSINPLRQPVKVDDVTIFPRLVADAKHYYYLSPGLTAAEVDSRRLLRSVGMTTQNGLLPSKVNVTDDSWDASTSHQGVVERPSYNLYDRVDTFYRRGDAPGHPSLLSSKKDSRSLRQRALAAASRIGDLQERRQQLLSGEGSDNMNPEMLRYQLAMIADQEAQLLQLFLGRTIRESVRYTVVPKDQNREVEEQIDTLFYFSSKNGIVDKNAKDAVPVICRVYCANELRSATRFVRHHTGEATNLDRRNTIKYRCPEEALVTVWSPLFRYEQTLSVAQYGPTMELPLRSQEALFDETTGDLIYLKCKF